MKGKTRKHGNGAAVVLMRIEMTPVACVWFTGRPNCAYLAVTLAKNQAKRQLGHPRGADPGSQGGLCPLVRRSKEVWRARCEASSALCRSAYCA
ncbi:hypothetical protein Arub01_30980 [Actinomadura rubrobrunea]|uniref:Uncharacterized protein n=1 Tax=Actinomadura rubrobrunea TaxID=115335 RepID=A0A9W6PXH5_9ACTN|nr:hypothetical protein Arub01_30980 [Actinomadura rubrobrunea]